ncbi:hypothetical protein HanRHA438_Chr03g0107891 [Helianthus annuus]|nr:hypothetical protein HanRHA438_Chr03g0107891 [Helianthus annuus]
MGGMVFVCKYVISYSCLLFCQPGLGRRFSLIKVTFQKKISVDVGRNQRSIK